MSHTEPEIDDTFDLTPHFRHALDGEPPFDSPERVALDRAERGGRRRRARAVASRSAIAVVCAATVGGAFVLVNPLGALHSGGSTSTPAVAARSAANDSASPTAPLPQVSNPGNKTVITRPGSMPPQDLMGVSLPDPAPGFPVRRSRDTVAETDGGVNPPFWTDVFLLAKTPDIVTTDANGNVSGKPTGPEVTVMVATSGTLFNFGTNMSRCQQGSGAYRVGSVQADVETGVEKGDHFTQLCFTKNQFRIQMTGSTGVTTTELVALGNAISGLG